MEQNIETISAGSLAIRFDKTSVTEMLEQRKAFEVFVKSQLNEKIDFGILPGTDKPSLWKPGAEKLASLFNLGSRIVKSDRVVEIKENFAMFAYTIELFHIPTGRVIAQCEGICNSQEVKYRSKKKYQWNKNTNRKEVVGEEVVQIGDVLNTLAKMAQKRAYVGAVIIATKASDFFNHDLNEDEEEFYENNPDYDQRTEEERKAALKKVQDSRNAAQPQSKATAGSFNEFKGGFVAQPKEPDAKAEDKKGKYLKDIASERIRLAWTLTEMQKYIEENFQKAPNKLSELELETLVIALKRTEKKK